MPTYALTEKGANKLDYLEDKFGRLQGPSPRPDWYILDRLDEEPQDLYYPSSSNLYRAISRLEREGYIERVADTLEERDPMWSSGRDDHHYDMGRGT